MHRRPTAKRRRRRATIDEESAPSTVQQIADLTAQAEAAVAAALADPTIDRTDLAEQIETVAQQVEAGATAESPYPDLAAHLRALAAQLIATDAEATDTP
jgi:hypothetical protein